MKKGYEKGRREDRPVKRDSVFPVQGLLAVKGIAFTYRFRILRAAIFAGYGVIAWKARRGGYLTALLGGIGKVAGRRGGFVLHGVYFLWVNWK